MAFFILGSKVIGIPILDRNLGKLENIWQINGAVQLFVKQETLTVTV